MKKKKFVRFVPIIIAFILMICGIIYAHINGISNEDILNRTSNFWLPYGMVVLGCCVIYIDTCVATIKKKDYFFLVIHIIQGIVTMVAFVYWIKLTDQILTLSQQIREFSHNENWTAANQLLSVRFDIWSKRHWLPLANTVTVYILNEIPILVRALQKKVRERSSCKNRGEDH